MSRVHLALIDLNGGLGRVDGGICFLTRANNTGAVIIEEQNGVYGSRSEAANLQRALHR